jgi:hypothetical protein
MAVRRKNTASKEGPEGGTVTHNLVAWRKVSCCETPAGKQPPTIDKLTVGIASRGKSLGIIFRAAHPCGLKKYSVVVTVVDDQGGTWTQTIEDSFDCDDGAPSGFSARWLWAVAKIAGGATYLGPLPGRIVSANATATVESCCGTTIVKSVTNQLY